MRKRISLVVCIVLTVVLAFTVSVFAYSSEVHHILVTPVVQAKTNWCWAACAEMAGKYMYSVSNRSQYDVVNYIKGTPGDLYPDVAGSIAETATGANYITYSNHSFSSIGMPFSFDAAHAALGNHHPVLAGCAHFTGTGHMVTIYNTVKVIDAGVTYTYVNYYDPADGNGYVCTYSDFCDGTYNGYSYVETCYVLY